MKTSLRNIDGLYQALMFVCPGCETEPGHGGLHMLPVNSSTKSPSWDWDGNREAPTLSPSILTHTRPYDVAGRPTGVCHSFLRAGVFEFLGDCTHQFSGQQVPLPDLYSWAQDLR